jgi:glycosyltransferase involved in cell wall biosynthesis
MLKYPKISVVMAVYNGESHIRSSVESILNQAYRDFEFIIVDDCSSDDTVNIIKTYNDSRIRIICNEKNIGQTKSLDEGLRIAKGEFIARIDVDDTAFPGRLEKQLNYMLKHSEYAAIGTSALKVFQGSCKKEVYKAACAPSEVMVRLFYTTPLLHVTVMMRKDAVLKVGGYDRGFLICADYALWSNLIRNKYKVISLPEILMKFKVSDESYSSRNQENIVSEYCKLLMDNINCMTDLQVSYQDARNLFTMFRPRSGELTDEEHEQTQVLFKDILLHLKEPWKVRISMREITRPLALACANKAAYRLKDLKIAASRRVIYSAVRKYGFNRRLFFILIAGFLGRGLLAKLIRLREASFY